MAPGRGGAAGTARALSGRMDTRVDGQSYDGSDETWLDERTAPDLDVTTLEGDVWPSQRRGHRTLAPAVPRSELEWR